MRAACSALSISPVSIRNFAHWRPTVVTTALVLGMAGQLGLTSPLWIQYFRLQPWEFGAPPNRLDWAFLACVVGQAAVVVTHLGRRRLVAWWGHLRAFITIPRLVLALIVFAFAAANITQFIQVALDRGAFPTRSYAMQLLAARFDR